MNTVERILHKERYINIIEQLQRDTKQNKSITI